MNLINAVEKICDARVKVVLSERRAGDVDALVANPTKAFNILKWKPQFSNIEFIVKSALAWEARKN